MKKYMLFASIVIAIAVSSCTTTKTGCNYGGMKKKFTADVNVPAILIRVAENMPGRAIFVIKPENMDTVYWHYTYTLSTWSIKPELPAVGTLYTIHMSSKDTCKPRTMFITRIS